jgi:hypothetical protein
LPEPRFDPSSQHQPLVGHRKELGSCHGLAKEARLKFQESSVG